MGYLRAAVSRRETRIASDGTPNHRLGILMYARFFAAAIALLCLSFAAHAAPATDAPHKKKAAAHTAASHPVPARHVAAAPLAHHAAAKPARKTVHSASAKRTAPVAASTQHRGKAVASAKKAPAAHRKVATAKKPAPKHTAKKAPARKAVTKNG